MRRKIRSRSYSYSLFLTDPAFEKGGYVLQVKYYFMMLGAKAPNYDTYGLLRAAHFHNPPQYSHIVGYSSHFHAHIGEGPKVLHPLMSKLMCVQTF